MMKPSLGILTWKSPLTLRNTLESWSILDKNLFHERFVYCQELDAEEISIAKEYDFEVTGSKNNLGIHGGFKAIAETSNSNNLLIMENDCCLVAGMQDVVRQIDIANSAIASNEVIVVKMEKYFDEVSGEYSPPRRYLRYWNVNDEVSIKKSLKRIFRYNNAESVKGYAIYSCGDPEKKFSNAIELVDGKYYRTISKYIPWSNRSIFVNKEWFLTVLIDFAERNPTNRLVNGLSDIEHSINSKINRKWWRSSDFKVGVLRYGITSHSRYDRFLADDKNITSSSNIKRNS